VPWRPRQGSEMAERARAHGGRKRVLVVGGGFGGMYTARHLEKRLPAGSAEILLVNPENFMLYTPLLPEAASGTVEPRHVVVPLRRVLRRSRLVIGRAVSLDVDRRTCTVQPPEGEARVFTWDRLVLAPGSVTRVPPIPGLAEHARGFKTLSEGIYLRNHVLRQLELADASDDAAERVQRCTFVVVGAGYAGTELVAELQVLTSRAITNYPGLRPRDVRWVLADVAAAIMPELGAELGRIVLRTLRHRGVEVRLETGVKEVGPDWVRLTDGEEIGTRTLVWTAGVAPNPLGARSGLPTDDKGRLLVDQYLTVQGRDDVFALGDIALVPDQAEPSGYAPPTAQHSLREAKVCAANLAASLGEGERRPFHFKGLGLAVNLADFKGVVRAYGVPLSGFLGWFAARSYHLLSMPTMTRRIRIGLDWGVALISPHDIAELGSLGREGRGDSLGRESEAS
jgi:NADH:ubiquinone reductase (H+-translocating)